MTEPRKQVTVDDVERRLILEHKKPYFDWLKQVVTLALAALTALLALQGHYVPVKPLYQMLLVVGWVALAVSILAGLYALRSEYSTPLSAAQTLRNIRRGQGEVAAVHHLQAGGGYPPPGGHRASVTTLVICFALALICICAFASVNLLLR